MFSLDPALRRLSLAEEVTDGRGSFSVNKLLLLLLITVDHHPRLIITLKRPLPFKEIVGGTFQRRNGPLLLLDHHLPQLLLSSGKGPADPGVLPWDLQRGMGVLSKKVTQKEEAVQRGNGQHAVRRRAERQESRA